MLLQKQSDLGHHYFPVRKAFGKKVHHPMTGSRWVLLEIKHKSGLKYPQNKIKASLTLYNTQPLHVEHFLDISRADNKKLEQP